MRDCSACIRAIASSRSSAWLGGQGHPHPFGQLVIEAKPAAHEQPQLRRELGINPRTSAKWWKRATVEDLMTGPKEPRSTVPTEAEEAAIVASEGTQRCRWTIVSMRVSARSRISRDQPFTSACKDEPCRTIGPSDNGECILRLPDIGGDKPKRREFKRYPIGIARMLPERADQDGETDTLRIDATHPETHRTASSLGLKKATA